MSDRNLRLHVILSAVDKLTGPFKNAQTANKRLAEKMKQTREQLKGLNNAGYKLKSFDQLSRSLNRTEAELDKARLRAQMMTREMSSMETPTKKQTRALEAQWQAVSRLEEKQKQETRQIANTRAELYRLGLSAKGGAKETERITRETERYNRQLAEQDRRLKVLAERQRRLNSIRSKYQKGQQIRRDMLGHGAGMIASGAGILMGVKPILNEAATYDKEMSSFRALGVGETILKDADKFANGMHIIGNSASDNLKTLKEAHAVLRHYDEAKMVAPELLKMRYATEFLTMHGLSDEKAKEFRDQSQEVLKIAELRNMINSPEDFKKSVNMSTQAMAASGGLVLPSDYMGMLKTGEMAAKQMSDEAFYFSMSHIIQQIGGDRTGTALSSAYSALMMGYMKLSAAEELNKIGLLKPESLRYSKTGKLARVEKDALVNSRKYQTDPFRYLIDEIVPRIQKKYPGLDETGIETHIAQLFSNRKAAGLFVTMYRERANMEKQIKAGHEAYKVDQLVEEGSKTAQGQELELASRKRDVYKQIGDTLLPIYIKGLKKLSEMLTKVTQFFDEHPTVARYLTIAVVGLGMILAIMGALTLALATLLGPLVVVRLGFSLLGIKGAGSIGLLSGAFKKFIGFFTGSFNLLKAHPILIIIAVIAGAAYLIYSNWDKLGPWFKQLWEGIKNVFFSVWEGIKNYLLNWTLFGLIYQHWDKIDAYIRKVWGNIRAYLSNKWNEIVADVQQLPDKFKQFGSDLIDRLSEGIKEKWKTFKAYLSNLGAEIKDALTPDFMKSQAAKPDVQKALDSYKSTGFGGAFDSGGYLPAGKWGLVGEHGPELINGPARITSRKQTAALAAMAALSLGAASSASAQKPLHPYSLPIAHYAASDVTKNRPTAPGYHAPAPAPIINIYPTPTQSAHDIAQAVARELDRREQQQRARARSAFADREEY